MDELKTLLADHSYSHWMEPRIVYKDGYNYFTTIGPDGYGWFHKYDGKILDSIYVGTFGSKDEHNCPSFLLRESDIFLVLPARNGNNMRVCTVDYDLTTVSSKINIGAAMTGLHAANYANIFEHNGRTFIFCRQDTNNWALIWSDDGLTFSQHKLLFNAPYDSGRQMYTSSVQDGEMIYIQGYLHPTAPATFLWSCAFNTTTGDISESGTSLGDVYDAGWTVKSVELFTKLLQPELTGIRFLDAAFSLDKTKIHALAVDFQADYEDGTYYLVTWDKGANTNISKTAIVASGKDTFISYFGCAYFAQTIDQRWNGDIFLAREAAGTWYVEKHQYNGTTFSLLKTIDTLAEGVDGLSLTRPEPPKGSVIEVEGEWVTQGLEVVYQKGDYFENYIDWSVELIGVQEAEAAAVETETYTAVISNEAEDFSPTNPVEETNVVVFGGNGNSGSEDDPTVPLHVKSITTVEKAEWNKTVVHKIEELDAAGKNAIFTALGVQRQYGPILKSVTPTSVQPGQTIDMALKGVFLDPDTTFTVVSISGIDPPTVNNYTFIDQNNGVINVTGGNDEGFFSLIANNGIETTTLGLLIVNLGEVVIPNSADYSNENSLADTSIDGIFKINQVTTNTFATADLFTIPTNEDFQLRTNLKLSEFHTGSSGGSPLRAQYVTFTDTVTGDNVYTISGYFGPSPQARLYVHDQNLADQTTVNRLYQWEYELPENIVIERVGTVWKFYTEGVMRFELDLLSNPNPLLIQFSAFQIDYTDLKYVKL
ncbi:MAG: hypothetical protein WBG71_00010 [Leeuwenhoekiella sp.]